jgi:hypothetical protein
MLLTDHTIFSISDHTEFESAALNLFRFQAENNTVYKEYIQHLGIKPEKVLHIEQIPFLPIQFFKTKQLISGDPVYQKIFLSSATTGMDQSKHYVRDLSLYEESFRKAFELFYGDIKNYCILALLPSYLEREGSSLVYMTRDLIEKSDHPDSGFYLNNISELLTKLQSINSEQQVLLLGVSFALLDVLERSAPLKRDHLTLMETGGMKGKRKEMVREELHELLRKGFGVQFIHSEYGMTELLSQAYSKGNGIFKCPPWMSVLIRDVNDPLTITGFNHTGGINVIDLANKYSCAFIATQDLGRLYPDRSFEVLGRFDNSELRGCNLLLENY